MYTILAHTPVSFTFVITQISCIYVPVVQTMKPGLLNWSQVSYSAEDHGPLRIVVDALKISPGGMATLGKGRDLAGIFICKNHS